MTYLNPGPCYELSAKEQRASDAYEAAEANAKFIEKQIRKIAEKAVADFIGFLSIENLEREPKWDPLGAVEVISDALRELAAIPDPEAASDAVMEG